MNEKTLRVLEYPKIIAMLSEETTSPLSREMAEQLVPSSDYHEVLRLQAETTDGVSLMMRRGNPPIGGMADVRPALKRAESGAALGPKELLDIAAVLNIASRMTRYIGEDRREESFPVLDPLFSELYQNRALYDQITLAVLNEEELADDASPALSALRRQMRNNQNKMKDTLQGLVTGRYAKFLQEPIITMRGERYVIPVKSEHKNDVPGIAHDASATGATVFIEPMAVVELGNELRGLMAKGKTEVERILSELSARVAENAEGLWLDVKLIPKLDLIFAKGKLALKMKAYPPKINREGYLHFKDARHPLISKDKIVPTTIYLGKDFHTLIITGPNTGGKTVALKTTGLFTLMAQSGLHLPTADGSEVSVFQKVFADIGDEQSIEQSLSTFSSHMTNIVEILGEADENSLVLFDELGAGTDPTEGAALAMTILEHLHHLGVRTVSTTHYSELKLFALSTPGISNAACEFDVETLRPTYKLLIGVPGKSNAFAISRRLGLGEDFIRRAEELLSKDQIQFEDVLGELEANRRAAEEASQRAAGERAKAERLREELEEAKESIDKKRERLLENARREARAILERAEEKADEAAKEIRALQKAKSEEEQNRRLEEARRKLKKERKEVEASLAESLMPRKNAVALPKDLRKGDSVLIVSLGQEAKVLKLPDDKGNVLVQAGIMQITVHVSNLRLLREEAPKPNAKSRASRNVGMAKAAAVKPEVDLRGKMLEEALETCEKFIDDCMLASLKQVTIIHGKGTGVLRNGIHQMLRKDKRVEDFRLGQYGEGDSGVTIVTFR